MKLDNKLINGEVINAHCLSCNRSTNQFIRAKFAPESQAEYELYKYNEYCIVECLGCNNISFIHVSWNDDEESKDENGDSIKIMSHFVEDERWLEDYQFLNEEELNELPAMIYDMYEELQGALQREMRVLAGVGMRMLIEAVCLNRKIEGKILQHQIESLLSFGLISKNDFEVLDELRKIGNNSAHKIKAPSDSVLEAALEAVNHLVRTIYVVPKRTRRLKGKSNK
ncbi:DUF4145 domain-containing protein [uncultured Roseivirga sp.]|uniref:DUF4145 domain-containing protein n=1 Tax=uncultured Roseivirga sp. TaxID=543088 RepID=UPI000D7A6E9C|nr:DUF4145 domain-containing protein [uncultured Roseivirga sp.]PWL31742.1 MAG: hypothetical protein DCO95_00730 [Roseivirga sp. XM-24bin3]